MSMLTETHKVVFADIREKLANITGLDHDFRKRLGNADKITLEITSNMISINIETPTRTEGFTNKEPGT